MFTYENQKFAAFINEIAWSLRDHAISLINAYGDKCLRRLEDYKKDHIITDEQYKEMREFIDHKK